MTPEEFRINFSRAVAEDDFELCEAVVDGGYELTDAGLDNLTNIAEAQAEPLFDRIAELETQLAEKNRLIREHEAAAVRILDSDDAGKSLNAELLATAQHCERLLLSHGDPFRGDDWQTMQDIRAVIAKARTEPAAGPDLVEAIEAGLVFIARGAPQAASVVLLEAVAKAKGEA